MDGKRKWLKRISLSGLITLLVGLIGTSWLLLTHSGQQFALFNLLGVINSSLQGNQLSISSVDIDWWKKIDIQNIELVDIHQKPLAKCSEIRLSYDIESLRQFDVQTLHIDIVEPQIYLDEMDDGWNWEKAFPPTNTEATTNDITGSPVNIDNFTISIQKPRITINKEEPVTIKNLTIVGEIHKEFDASLNVQIADILIEQYQYPLDISLKADMDHNQIQGQLALNSEIQFETDLVLEDFLKDPQFELQSKFDIPPLSLQNIIKEPIPQQQRIFELEAKGNFNHIHYDLFNQERSLRIHGNVDLLEQKVSSEMEFQNWRPQLWIQDLPEVISTGRFVMDGQGFSLEDFVGNWTVQQSELIVDTYVFDEILLRGTLETGQILIPEMSVEHELFDMEITATGDVQQMIFDIGADLNMHPVESWNEDFGIPPLKGTVSIKSHIAIQEIPEVDFLVSGNIEDIDYPDLDMSEIVLDIKGRYTDELTASGNIQSPKISFADVNVKDSFLDFQMSYTDHLSIQQNLSIASIDLTEDVQLLNLSSKGTLVVDENIVFDTPNMTTSSLSYKDRNVFEKAIMDIKYDNNDIIVHLDIQDATHSLLVSEAMVRDLETIELQKLDLYLLSDHQLSLDDQQKAVISASDLNLFLEGSAEETISLVVKDGGNYVHINVEDFEIAFLNEVMYSIFGEYVFNKEAFSTLELSMTLEDQNIEGFVQSDAIFVPDMVNLQNTKIEIGGTLEDLTWHIQTSETNQAPWFLASGNIPLTKDFALHCGQNSKIQMTLEPKDVENLHHKIPLIPLIDQMDIAFYSTIQKDICDPRFQLHVSVGYVWEEQRIQNDIVINRDVDDQIAIQHRSSIKPKYFVGQRTVLTSNGFLKGNYSQQLYNCIHGESCFSTDEDYGILDVQGLLTDVILSDYYDIEDVTAQAEFQFAVTGTLFQPEIQGMLLTHGLIAEQPYELGGGIEYMNNHVQFNTEGDFGDGHLEAKMRWMMDNHTLDGMVVMRKLSLGILDQFIDDIDVLGGRISSDIAIKGTLDVPQVEGLVELDKGKVHLPLTGITYQDINIVLQGHQEEIEIKSLSLRSSYRDKKGLIRGDGKYHLQNGGYVQMNLTDFYVIEDPQISLILDGSLRSDFSDVIQITGDLDVIRGFFNVRRDTFLSNASLQIDPRIQFHHLELEEEEENAAEESKYLEYLPPIYADVKVDLGSGVFFRAGIPTVEDFGAAFSRLATVNLDITMNGELQVGMVDFEPRILGEITTNRGSVNAMGVGFEVEKGTISFVGKEYWNPEMDVQARKNFGQYGDIIAKITGSTSNMSLDFSSGSEDKNYDQTDIFSLMLIGKPTSEITEAQGQAAQFLISSALSTLGGSLTRAIGGNLVDEFSWDPSQGSFRIGKSYKEKLFFSIEKNNKNSNEGNIYEFSLEWQIMERMYGEFITGDSNDTSAQIYYQWRF